MRKLIFIPFIALILSSCATVKTPYPIKGSKSDGTITMAYEVGAFEKPVIDWQLVKLKATRRCQAWNYKDAEAFGGSTERCVAYNQYGCVQEVVSIQYQCV